MQQIYRKTSATLKAEAEIKKSILASPLPIERTIPVRLFNALINEIPADVRDGFISDIPYKHEAGDSFVEYILRCRE